MSKKPAFYNKLEAEITRRAGKERAQEVLRELDGSNRVIERDGEIVVQRADGIPYAANTEETLVQDIANDLVGSVVGQDASYFDRIREEVKRQRGGEDDKSGDIIGWNS